MSESLQARLYSHQIEISVEYSGQIRGVQIKAGDEPRPER